MKKMHTKKQDFRFCGSPVFLSEFKNIKRPVLKILFPLALLLGSVFLYKTGIGCVWRYLFNIPCIGCGMTRAFLALLKGEILLSLKMHFMLFSLPIVYLYILFDGKPFKSQALNLSVAGLLTLGFIIKWIISLINI